MKSWKMLYEVLMILIVLTYAIVMLATPTNHPLLTEKNLNRLDWFFIAFLAMEYIFRLVRSDNKRKFVKDNWFELIALIPVSTTFRLARMIRVIRLIRIMKASPLLWEVVMSRQIQMMLVFVSILLLWSSLVIYFLEKGINTNIKHFGDALWWSIVTTTTVGYGDISPTSFGGRVIAVILMLTGIGMIGTVTANLANHWVTHFGKEKNNHTVYDDLKGNVVNWVNRVEHLTDEEYETMLQTLETIRKGPKG